MLYYLCYQLLREDYSWLNVFKYQTFRAMLAFLIAFLFVLFFEPIFIRKLRKLGVKGQPIRDDGPQSHEGKQGTPTMGGLVIVAAVLFSSLLLTDLTNTYVWTVLLLMTGYAVLGFFDDWKKVMQQDTAGLSGKMRLRWEFGLAGAAALFLMLSGFSTELSLPFFKELELDLWIFFIPFAALVIVGCANAVNLTDGLDGLAIGPVMTVGATYAVFAYLTGRADYADYLAIPRVEQAGELSIILSAVVAGGLGFLWYNTFPAQIFMGDIGALALGGCLGICAVIVKHELVLALAGGVFVVEALSVIIQTTYFKMTGGKRVFRMAPIHHHFELAGWAEPKIIVRFWIISIVLAIISLTTLKLR